MAADQVQEKPKEPEAKASDAAAGKAAEAPQSQQEKDAVGAQAKLSDEASGKPADAQNSTDAAGTATKDASDSTDTAETGEALTPWQKELQDLQKEREELDRKMKSGELDANGVERHKQLEAGFKSMDAARAAGMSEAQIRAQFGNLVLEDKGSRSIELDGKASGRDRSTEGNFSLTMDGNQLVKFDDASWGISKDSSASASIKVTLPESAASVENAHGKMSVVPGADGTNARIIEMKDGTVLVNRGDEYVAMKPGTMGFGQQVLEGAEAKKLFEAEETKYDGVETTNAGGKISVSSNGVNLVNVAMGQRPDIQSPESAQVMAQNEHGKLMKLDDGTQMITGPDSTAMIRSANGDVVKVDSSGQITEMKAANGDATEAWNSEYKKFESDVKVAGSDGGSLLNLDNWTWDNFTSTLFGNDTSDLLDHDYCVADGDFLASAKSNPFGDARADLAAADSQPGIMGSIDSYLDNFSLYRWGKSGAGSVWQAGKEAWSKGSDFFSDLGSLSGGTEMSAEASTEFSEKYKERAVEGDSSVETIGKRGKLDVTKEGEISAERNGVSYDRYSDGTEKISSQDGNDYYRQGDQIIVRNRETGSTRTFDKENNRAEFDLATGLFDQWGKPITMKADRHIGGFDPAKVREGRTSTFDDGSVAEGDGTNDDVTRFFRGEDNSVMAELHKADGTIWRGKAQDFLHGNMDKLLVRGKEDTEFRAPTPEEIRANSPMGPPTADGVWPNPLGLHTNAQGLMVMRNGQAIEARRDGRPGLRLSQGRASIETGPDSTVLTDGSETHTVTNQGVVETRDTNAPPESPPKSTFDFNTGVLDSKDVRFTPESTYFKPMDFTADLSGNLFNGDGLNGSMFFNSATGEFDQSAYDSYDGWENTGWSSPGYDGYSNGGYADMSSAEYKAAETEGQSAIGTANTAFSAVLAKVAIGEPTAISGMKGIVMSGLGEIDAAMALAAQTGNTGMLAQLSLQKGMLGSACNMITQSESIQEKFSRLVGPGHSYDMTNAIRNGTRTFAVSEWTVMAEALKHSDPTNPLVERVLGKQGSDSQTA